MGRKVKGPAPKYPEFGRRVSVGLDATTLTWKQQAKMVGCTEEMLRRYRNGDDMPREKRMKKLADLIGASPAELRYGEKAPAPGVIAARAVDLTPDEQRLLQMYREMPEEARRVLRARASQLLESFGVPGPGNPFGKHSQ